MSKAKELIEKFRGLNEDVLRDVQTQKEAEQILKDRGFTDYKTKIDHTKVVLFVKGGQNIGQWNPAENSAGFDPDTLILYSGWGWPERDGKIYAK